MTPDDLDPTPELLAAVRAERERVAGFVTQLLDRQGRLSDELAAVTAQLDAARERERQLLRVLGDEHDQEVGVEAHVVDDGVAGRAVDDDTLRGAAIRRAAVDAALGDAGRPGAPRHYRDWLALIEASGRRVDGRDPGATLLTQLSRCPLIVRAPEAGTYQLDPGALARLHRRRDELRAEADAQVATASEREYDALVLAEGLARVQSDIQRTERAIVEAEELIVQLDAAWFFTGDNDRREPVAAHPVAA